MIEGPPKPKEESLERNGREKLSPEEKSEWLSGMEKYAEQLEQEVLRLKGELGSIKNKEEQKEAQELILELEE
ncbi:MAG TPA: hypothetical protein ENI66_00490 [Candidatus Yonathbacteria bacterium]|nr:hypothetical protein [Candidatus Yonathbacteria bacterium]